MSEKTVISSFRSGLQLFKLLAADFQPRSLKQIIDLAKLNGHDWSQTKVFDMLNTLAAEQFVRKTPSGDWAIDPHVTAIAVSYQESVIRRTQAILDETAELKNTIEERMK